jgi:hypothetical protein
VAYWENYVDSLVVGGTNIMTHNINVRTATFIGFLLVIFVFGIQTLFAGTKLRKFYLTQDEFQGNQALTACAEDYHMATLWEIYDFSNLKYDRTLGLIGEDSEAGPPPTAGWIRTAGASYGDTFQPGADNCLLWTTSDSSKRGSIVHLFNNWASEPSYISPWRSDSIPCSFDLPVWCVEDN